jgi:hypothetical protein
VVLLPSARFPSNTSTIEAEVDGIRFHKSWKLGEVSIVRTPANPDCWCLIWIGNCDTGDLPPVGARGERRDTASGTGSLTSALTWKGET